MSGTALDHPLVRDYLRELDRALFVLPFKQASELIEQIRAHLDDALEPDTGDEEVAAVLTRLGRPADLAAEAATGRATTSTAARPGTSPRTSPGTSTAPSPPSPSQGRRRRRRRLAWTSVVAVGAVTATIVSYVVVVSNVGRLQAGGASGWWFRRDAARAVYAQADGARQTSVPIRLGQRQGLAVVLYNPTGWTQTILGQWEGSNAPGNAVRSRMTISMSTGSARDFRSLRYHRPGSIPPHQSRWVRLLWYSNVCLDKGSGMGNDQLAIRVRVGGLDREEIVPLRQGWYVTGPSHGRCV
jgi:hypothetical protein